MLPITIQQMTSRSTGKAGGTEAYSLGSLDSESVERIDVHLERALRAEDVDEARFHVRHARQLLEACRN